MMEFIHADKYGIALNLCKKFVSKNDGRPILQYALHQDDGTLVATNSHKLIYVPNIHGFKENLLINPKNMMTAKGKYPIIDHAFEDKKHRKSIIIDKDSLKAWLQIFKSLNQLLTQAKDVNKMVTFHFENDSFYVKPNHFDIKIELPFTDYIKVIDEINVSAEVFRDALEAQVKMDAEIVDITLRASNQPIKTKSKQVMAIVMPIRTY